MEVSVWWACCYIITPRRETMMGARGCWVSRLVPLPENEHGLTECESARREIHVEDHTGLELPIGCGVETVGEIARPRRVRIDAERVAGDVPILGAQPLPQNRLSENRVDVARRGSGTHLRDLVVLQGD